MITKLRFTLLFLLLFISLLGFAQAPNISYPASQTYTVGTAITPVNTGGSVASSGYGSGAVSIGYSLPGPTDLVVDAAGNLYIGSNGSGSIYEITTTGYQISLGSGFTHPYGVAVDAIGNVYVADQGKTFIVEIQTNGTMTTVGSGMSNPIGVAVDAQGNVFASDVTQGVVFKFPAGGGTATTIGSGFVNPVGLAVDAANNIYVADYGNNTVKMIPGNGGPTVVIGSGFNNPLGVSVDAAGNVYIADTNNSAIKEIVASQNTTVTLFEGFGFTSGVAIDSKGNIYVSDQDQNFIRKFQPSGGYFLSQTLPAGLNFNYNTGIITGTPIATVSPTTYTVTASNSSGNDSFYFSIGVNAPQTITFPAFPTTITYGAVDFPTGASANSGLPVSYVSSNTNVATIVNGSIHIVGTGTATITASQAGDNVNYAAAANVTQTLTVSPAPLTIAANNAKRLAGVANPTFTASYTGFVNSETASVLTSPPALATTATVSSLPGLYPITVSGAAAKNYTITYVSGVLNVALPPPAITYNSPQAYMAGTAISSLKPTNTGGAVQATVYGKVTKLAGIGNVANPTFNYARGVAVDAAGNIYVADQTANLIRKVTQAGVVTTFAGSGKAASTDGTGTAASFYSPTSIAIDAAGNFYVTDASSNKIRKITSGGVVTTYAGTGVSGFTNGAALTVATFTYPQGIAVDGAGNVYVADSYNNQIREISVNGIVSTLAGSRTVGAANGTGAGASFNMPVDIASDAKGNVYVADQGNNMVRKITPAGVVTTLAGSITAGSADGIGTAAGFNTPAGIAVDSAMNVYVSDQGNFTIRQINPAGTVTTLAGKGNGDTTNNVGSQAGFMYLRGLAADANGNLYAADQGDYSLRKIITTGYHITPLLPAGLSFDSTTGTLSGMPNSAFSSVGYTVTAYNTGGSSSANLSISVAAPPIPNIAYSGTHTFAQGVPIAPFSPVNLGGAIQANQYLIPAMVAGGSSVQGANGTGEGANFTYGFGLALDAAGNIYVADTYSNLVRKVTPAGVSATLAGSGQQGAADGTGPAATFNYPQSVAVDAAGDVYVADHANNLIREITPAGVVTTFAGNGTSAPADGTGIAAGIPNPNGLVIDKAGNLYVVSAGVRKITPAGVVTTLTTQGFSAEYMAIDGAGNLYVASSSPGGIYKITPAGVVTAVTHNSVNSGIAVDNAGNIYFSDVANYPSLSGSNRISRVNTDGTITPLIFGYGGSLVIDNNNNLYASVNQAIPQGDYNVSGIIGRIVATNYYSITPALPQGLIFNDLTGAISGTAFTSSPATVYTVSAYNSGGLSTTNLTISVAPLVAPKITYSSGFVRLTAGVAISPLTPANTGGAVPATIYGQTTTVAGSGAQGAVNGPAASASFYGPDGVCLDGLGNLYVADGYNALIRKITPAGIVSTFAGVSHSTGAADGYLSSATFYDPATMVVHNGSIYISDNYGVRQITPDGLVQSANFGGSNFESIVFDGSGNVDATLFTYVNQYPFDTNNQITIAGKYNKSGFANGQDTAARFYGAYGIALDAGGNMYIADEYNNQIRKISPTNLVTTFAGSITPGLADGTGAAAGFNLPISIVSDGANNLYVADLGNYLIRKIAPDGAVTTLAGSGNYGYADGIGSAASFAGAQGLALDVSGDLYIADQSNNRVRKVATNGYTISPALPAGLSFDGTTGIISGTPQTSATGSYTVTAYNYAGSSSAIINFGVSSNAGLSNLALSKGTLSPVFTTGTNNYTATVTNGTASITVTPTLADATASVTVNGTTVISGKPSAAIVLTVGTNTITTIVTAQDGTTKQTYTVTITRPSTNAKLSALTLSAGTLSPVFNANTSNYTTTVPYATVTLTVTPTVAVSGSTIAVNGTGVASGSATGGIALNAGVNTITMVVTAQDGVTMATYTLTVTRAAPSGIATLANLTINKGTLTPVFATSTIGYTDAVTNGTASVTLTPTATDASASIMVNGAPVISGRASAAIALAVGLNTVTVVVTAEDGTNSQTYTVTVTRPSTNAKLTGLSISSGTLSPAFSGSTINYTVSVPYNTSSLTLTPTVAVAGSTVSVNGTAVASGTASGAIALSTGANTVPVVSIAQDGVTAITYTVTITRALESANDNLSALTISKGALSPTFSATVSTYTDMVTNGTASVTVTPTATDAAASITVNGTPVLTGKASGSIALAVGSNAINVVVTAQNSTSQTYSVIVIRPSTNAKLAGLSTSSGTLSPVFSAVTTTYTASVNNGVSSIMVTPTVAVTGATVKVNGVAVTSGTPSAAIALNVGANTITTVVTAQDGITTYTYSLTVTRAASANNNLSALVVSKGALSPVFATATTVYADMVTNGTASLTLTPTVADATATVTVNGAKVTSGNASGNIALSVGVNTVSIIVIAQSGVTKMYIVSVTRPSTNAKLSALTISNGTLTPAFNANTTNYTSTVTSATSTIKVTPTVAVTGATIKVNGTAVTSGTPSAAIALSVGSNTITTVVTAQDGVTTDTYTLEVTRPAGLNIPNAEISVQTPTDKPLFEDELLVVHQGISPNGDGVNDFLVIDGISAYPDNKLSIMNRNGQLVFEAKGYDNSTKTFDGHSNKNGQMQLPGTYFYSLNYSVKGIVNHKTGFLVLKY